jgi:YesN/AraC family two-component response regulator
MRVLIADDEKEFVNFLKGILVDRGHEADTACDGEEALELIKKKKYDILFMDHNMPGLTGLEIVEYVKENKIRSKTVIVTGYEPMSEEFARAVGADEYLEKPVAVRAVEAILKRYRAAKGA